MMQHIISYFESKACDFLAIMGTISINANTALITEQNPFINIKRID